MLVPIPNPNSSEEQFRKDTARIIAQLASTRLGENASPMFAGITITGLTASRLMATDSVKALASVADLTSWVAGTANRVTIADDGDGTITISGPQDIHTGASPTFVAATLTGLTATRLMATNGSKVTVSSDLVNWVAGTANEVNVTDDGDGTITIGLVDPLIVSKGGTGSASLTDHGLLLGSGTGAITALGVATDGQIPIGATGADPVLAEITGTANQITVTNAAGGITLSLPQDIDTSADVEFDSVVAAISTATANAKALYGELTFDASGGDVTYATGIRGQIYTSGGNNITNNISGLVGVVTHNGTGTVALARGMYGQVQSVAAGTTTLAYTLSAVGPYRTAGTISTIYGVHIGAHKVTGVTTAYGIYQAGASDLNYFAGVTSIGTTASSAVLHIDQSSTSGAKPPLLIDQADVSEEFIRFIGSAANGVLTQSIVAAADVTTATIAGYIRVYVQDDGNQIADQAYYMPIYTLA